MTVDTMRRRGAGDKAGLTKVSQLGGLGPTGRLDNVKRVAVSRMDQA